jgi:hypothetical protein
MGFKMYVPSIIHPVSLTYQETQIRARYASMRGGVSHLVEDSVDGLESTTGLKLRDATIGRANDTAAKAQDKAGSFAQTVQKRAAELHERASGIANDVQARLSQQDKPTTKVSPDAPEGLLAKKREQSPDRDVRVKVEQAVRDVRDEVAAALGVAKGTW